MLAEKERAKEARETRKQEKEFQKETDGKKGNGHTLVMHGIILGTIPIGTAKRNVSRWIRRQLLKPFLTSLQLA